MPLVISSGSMPSGGSGMYSIAKVRTVAQCSFVSGVRIASPPAAIDSPQ